MINRKEINRLLERAKVITGATVGGVAAGYLWGGTGGALTTGTQELVQATFGQTVEHALSDLANRQLSSREEIRVGAAAVFAINKIWQRLLDGDLPRNDGFFGSQSSEETDRSPAEEIFEGSMLKCKSEHQEKKLKLIANIAANTAFDANVSQELANQVLLIAERLSYRQLCMIAIVARSETIGFDTTRWNSSAFMQFENSRRRANNPAELSAFVRELYSLSPNQEAILSYSRQDIVPKLGWEAGKLTELGEVSSDLMGLAEIDETELRVLLKQYEEWTGGK